MESEGGSMARLIDADALICDIENNFWDYETVDGISATLVLKQTVKDIRNYPTVDAVEVVRCNDCKFLHDKGYCTLVAGLTRIEPDDYCSRGERRNDG